MCSFVIRVLYREMAGTVPQSRVEMLRDDTEYPYNFGVYSRTQRTVHGFRYDLLIPTHIYSYLQE